MRCDECDYWLVAKITTYDDGSTVESYRAPQGLGHCENFDRDSRSEFFCADFKQSGWDHIEKKHKSGEPWQHWRMDGCPDCTKKGQIAAGCQRCCSTGFVRYYDDGYIGEERTRLHPKEKAAREPPPPPKCIACAKTIDPEWMNCPWCGARTNKPSELEIVEDGAIKIEAA